MRKNIRNPYCPVCGQNDRVSFGFKRSDNAIHSCRRCDVEFLFPQPEDETLSSIYSSSYFLGGDDSASVWQRESLKRATARLYLETLKPFVDVSRPRLLEIGCGSGDFLLEAQSRGFEVEGLEYSEHAAAEANERFGRQVVSVGSPEKEGNLREKAYDVIGAFDVIEHVRNPRQSLNCLYGALRPSGLLVLVTPSIDSWSRLLLRSHWMEYKTEHLTYFSRRSLARLLRATGFDTAQFFPNYKILSLDYISAHFKRFPVPVAGTMVRFLRSCSPERLAHMPMRIAASGMMALARKAD